jgi:hypothetical protein
MAEPITVTDGEGVVDEMGNSPELFQTESYALSQLSEDVGDLNNRTKLLHDDTNELHQDILINEWSAATSTLIRRGIQTLLSDLADLGFAWRDIARLVGVSVPAIQRWRKGSPAAGENRTAAAAALAACNMITKHYVVEDVASWFESPILSGYPVCPIDLYSTGMAAQVFHLAGGHANPEEILTAFDPEWRETYRHGYEIVSGDEGLSLREKSD